MFSLNKLLIAIALVLTFNVCANAQNNTDQALEKAKEVSQQFVDDHNIDEEKQVYITRVVYSYNKNLARLNAQEDLSEAQIDSRLSEMKSSLSDLIKNALNDNQLTEEFIQEFEFE
ncbi:MAG: hypothetical protein RI558_00130 [Psychroflexus sp.]|jgi:cell division septum initiation protein DivIVA|nr:hypothetical protein [Psychroflexus sp.]MDR9447610.1 hypothetical protein [Psychroflexus sp.]